MSAAATPAAGVLLLAGVSLFWGVNWPVMKVALGEVPAWSFRALCVGAGGVGLLAIARLAGRSLRIPTREAVPLVVVSFFNITVWHLCSAFGLVYMAAGRAAIIAFTMPLWAAVLAVPLLRERLTSMTLAGLALGLTGMAVLVVPDWPAVRAAPLGPLFMLVAAMSWATGTVGLKYCRFTMPVSVLTGWQLLLGGLPVILGALWFDAGFDFRSVGADAWLATLYAASIPMVFCHWAWFKAVTIFPAVVAAIGTLAIPVIGVLSSALALGEPVGADALTALVLVLAALVLVLVLPAVRRPAVAAAEGRR